MKINLERGILPIGPAPMPPAMEAPDRTGGFDRKLLAAIREMEEAATAADRSAEGLVTGEVDLHEAMVAMEKADLVIKLGTTVRNKILDAYQQLLSASG